MKWSWDIDRTLPEPVRVILRGAGQVVFCGNAVTGFFVLAAFYLSGLTAGLAATVGVTCGTLAAYGLKFCKQYIQAGLYGFNGILVSVCLSVFIELTPLLWFYIVIASLLSSIVWAMMAQFLQFCRLPPATSPFVLISWVFLMMLVPSTPLSDTAFSNAAAIGNLPFETWVVACAHSVSQILFSDHVLVGGLLLIGIAITTLRGALMAIGGAMIGVMLPFAIGIDPKIVEAGLYGFNPILTMIALGWIFLKPTHTNTLWTILAGMLAVIGQIILSSLLNPLGLPVLASPFILTLWIVLLTVHKFRPSLLATSS